MALVLVGCGGGDVVEGPSQSAPVAQRAEQHPQTAGFDANALMDWAQLTYPQYFPGTRPNNVSGSIVYRGYPNGNYVGTDGTNVYIMGPVAVEQGVGGLAVPGNVGTLASFSCRANSPYCQEPANASVSTFVRSSGIDVINIDRFGSVWYFNQADRVLMKVIGPNLLTTVAGRARYLLPRADGQGTAAVFANPGFKFAMDKFDNAYLCDGKIRKINPEGYVSTINVDCYALYAVDAEGNMYIDEGRTGASFVQISKVTLDGSVSIFANSAGVEGSANGPRLQASFGRIDTIIFDRQGNMLISDFNNDLIRKISTAGIVTTFSGNPVVNRVRLSTDGPPAVARFRDPMGLALDDFGNLYVGERGKVRKVAPDGYVSTILGNPDNPPSDGTHPNAGLCYPVTHSLALKDPSIRSGILYLSDCGNQLKAIQLPRP